MFAAVALLVLGAVYLVVRLGFRQWQLRRPSGDGHPAEFGGQDLGADSRHRQDSEASDVTLTVKDEPAVHSWTNAEIQTALGEIDWYQFEKYCAALLCREGFDVDRKGGAQPDGGVDLIASRDGERMLVQCKHWRTWVVQEKVVREMLGSMAHFQATRGSIYTLKGWTKPAAEFARQHGIALADADDLAHRGLACLEADQLARYLNPQVRHCPKCEAEMVLRTGNFTSFWGCSTYPRCRGKPVTPPEANASSTKPRRTNLTIASMRSNPSSRRRRPIRFSAVSRRLLSPAFSRHRGRGRRRGWP